MTEAPNTAPSKPVGEKPTTIYCENLLRYAKWKNSEQGGDEWKSCPMFPAVQRQTPPPKYFYGFSTVTNGELVTYDLTHNGMFTTDVLQTYANGQQAFEALTKQTNDIASEDGVANGNPRVLGDTTPCLCGNTMHGPAPVTWQDPKNKSTPPIVPGYMPHGHGTLLMPIVQNEADLVTLLGMHRPEVFVKMQEKAGDAEWRKRQLQRTEGYRFNMESMPSAALPFYTLVLMSDGTVRNLTPQPAVLAAEREPESAAGPPPGSVPAASALNGGALLHPCTRTVPQQTLAYDVMRPRQGSYLIGRKSALLRTATERAAAAMLKEETRTRTERLADDFIEKQTDLYTAFEAENRKILHEMQIKSREQAQGVPPSETPVETAPEDVWRTMNTHSKWALTAIATGKQIHQSMRNALQWAKVHALLGEYLRQNGGLDGWVPRSLVVNQFAEVAAPELDAATKAKAKLHNAALGTEPTSEVPPAEGGDTAANAPAVPFETPASADSKYYISEKTAPIQNVASREGLSEHRRNQLEKKKKIVVCPRGDKETISRLQAEERREKQTACKTQDFAFPEHKAMLEKLRAAANPAAEGGSEPVLAPAQL